MKNTRKDTIVNILKSKRERKKKNLFALLPIRIVEPFFSSFWVVVKKREKEQWTDRQNSKRKFFHYFSLSII